MSWVARKIGGLDNEDQKMIEAEYFASKRVQQMFDEQKKHEQEELKKFWAEYGDEYFHG